MLNWLFGKKKSDRLPVYSALRSVPSRGLPAELKETERSEAFVARRAALTQELLEPPRRPADDSPLLTTFFNSEQNGFVTITPPDGQKQCLAVFSTPIRATDYLQTLLGSDPALKYLASTPAQFIKILRDLGEIGIEKFALDRCPRCTIFSVFDSGGIKMPGDVMTAWAIHKSAEFARADLYLGYALRAARKGFFQAARDVALETVGHVTIDDSNAHFLLGQIAVGMRDQTLLREAKAFLRFFNFDLWETRLDRIVKSGTPDFDGST